MEMQMTTTTTTTERPTFREQLAAREAERAERLAPYLHLVPALPCRISWQVTNLGKTQVNADIFTDALDAAERILGLLDSRFGTYIPCIEALDQLPEPEVRDWTLHGPTVEVTLPHRFYDDHCNRDGHPGQVVRRMKTGVRVLLDAAAYDDLLGDANYYADASDFGPDYLGLCASARGTAQRLTRAGRPA